MARERLLELLTGDAKARVRGVHVDAERLGDLRHRHLLKLRHHEDLASLVVELVEQAAAVYVEMFRSTVWQEFADAGMPADGWPGIQAVVEGLEPVAAQALLASFRSAMAAAVAEEVDSQLSRLPSPKS